MDQEVLDFIEKLDNIVDNTGVAIRFADKDRDILVLSEAIKKALEAVRNKKVEENSEKSTKANEETAKELKKLNNSLKDRESRNKGLEDQNEALNEETRKWFKVTDAQLRRILETTGQIALNTASLSYDATKKKFNWLYELEKAGIRLSGGFEESFTKLANSAKMSQDSFAKMLVANSKQVAKMNAMGSETMASMMQASGNLVGKFGFNADEASKIMLHYMDTVGSLNTAEQLRYRNVTTEVERLGKQMKYLSHVTGKSVDVLLQEQEQRRNNLLMEKIYNDPKLKGFMDMGLSAGISQEVMLAAITGRPNEQSSQMNITAGGRALNRTLQNITQGLLSGTMTDEDAASSLKALQSDSRIVNDVQAMGKMSYGKAGALNDTALGNNLFSLSKFMRAAINPNQNKEGESVIGAVSDLKSAWNEMINTHIDKLGISFKNLTPIIETFTGVIKTATEWTKALPDWAYATLAGTLLSITTARSLKMLFKMKALDLAVRVIKFPFKFLGGSAKLLGGFFGKLGKGVSSLWNVTKSLGSKMAGLKGPLSKFGSSLTKFAKSAMNSLKGLKGPISAFGKKLLGKAKEVGSAVSKIIPKGASGVAKGVGKTLGKVGGVAASVGFEAYDLYEKGADQYLQEKRENGLKGWDLINPISWGQQVGLAIGVDKFAEWVVDKIMPNTPVGIQSPATVNSPAQQNIPTHSTSRVNSSSESVHSQFTGIAKDIHIIASNSQHLESMDQTSKQSYENTIFNKQSSFAPVMA